MTARSVAIAAATILVAGMPVAYAQEARSSGQQARGAAAAQETAAASQSRATAAPHGFSVVLVLGDLQGTGTADDVPPAAKKALTDMRDFLPFKSYRLLDAAWVLCCGSNSRQAAMSEKNLLPPRGAASTTTQVLRGPEDQEYELRLTTSRADAGRVFVDFSLRSLAAAAAAGTAGSQLTRQLADLTDQKALLEVRLQEARKRVDVGVAPQVEVTTLELELRSLQRRITDLTERVNRAPARSERAATPTAVKALIDTSFTMNVGETVVVGTSRQRGGSRALIALLTAVPPRGGTRNE
jgi:hypothetical protein